MLHPNIYYIIANEYLNMSEQNNTQSDTNFNYYHQYCRLYLANVVLMSQMRELVNERNQLSSKFVKLQKKGEEIQEGQRSQDHRHRRFRRTASQIDRHYRCPVETCQKSYGSQGSLNQHLKLKHYELYEKLNINKDEKSINESAYKNHSQEKEI